MSPRSLSLSLLFILVFSGFTFSMEETFVLIDSLNGKAEVQRAGQEKWVLVRKNTKLYNNDIIRVLERSIAKIKWLNGSVIYVNARSQILINLHRDTVNNKISNYATVFFGAVFFIVEKTLPRGIFTRHDTKIYTPTASIAIRGTSFLVDVKKDNGTTLISMLNGTVLAKNILKSQSSFITAGYKTEISLNSDPLSPKPLLKQDIENIKKWVPSQIIIDEMNKQIVKAKRDYSAITGKLEDKIIIVPFRNMSKYKGSWDIENRMAHLLSKKATSLNRVNCAVAKQDKEYINAITTGIKEKARFVITGEIKRFEIIQRAEVTASADRYLEHAIAYVCLEIQLIDVEQKKQLYKNDICGEVAGKNIEKNSWKHIANLSFNMENSKFSSTIIGKAVNQAIDQSFAHLARYMGM